LTFGSTQAIAAVSPLIAGLFKDWLGIEFVFYYAAAVIALAALVLFAVPLPTDRTQLLEQPH
jgi:hypothetical protein